jgi:hypothetical protein
VRHRHYARLYDDLRTAQHELQRMNRAYGQRLTPVGPYIQQFDTGLGAQAWGQRAVRQVNRALLGISGTPFRDAVHESSG